MSRCNSRQSFTFPDFAAGLLFQVPCMAAHRLPAWQSGQSIEHFNCFTNLLMSLHYHRGHDPSCTQQQKGKKNQIVVVTDNTRVVRLDITDPEFACANPFNPQVF